MYVLSTSIDHLLHARPYTKCFMAFSHWILKIIAWGRLLYQWEENMTFALKSESKTCLAPNYAAASYQTPLQSQDTL